MRWKPIIRMTGLTLVILLAVVTVAVVVYLRLPWISTETVRFRSGEVELVGTLAIPRWSEGPFAAAVVVHGSGSMPRWVYWSHVRYLVPHGMAVLIYDKRGVGDSAGENPQNSKWSTEGIASCGTKFNILAGDALAAVDLLKSRSDIDKSRIGFTGVSQAGWIMPMAASRRDDIAFIVSISGPAVSCGLEDWHSQLSGEYAAYPERGGPVPFAPGELSQDEIDLRLDEYEGPHGYDPEPVLAKLTVPTLWLFGGLDESLPTRRSVANLERLISKGAPFDIKIYPEGDHALRYPNSQRRFNYWQDAQEWLVSRGILIQQ